MPAPSLRGKIFVLVVAVLLSLAATMMFVTQRTVTATIVASEHHAVRNVMALLRREIDTRWASLLSEKVEIVVSRKQQLRQMGQTVLAMIAAYADLAHRGVVSEGAARGLARAWIKRLNTAGGHDILIYDSAFRVLASNRPALIDLDLTPLADIKGRAFASAMRDENASLNQDFALFRWPAPGYRSEETRFGHFSYFPQWDWVLMVDDGLQSVVERAQSRREQMEYSLRETLSQLTLAQSGFVMILDEQGQAVVPAPPRSAALLASADKATGKPLAELLRPKQTNTSLRSIPFSNDAGPWLIDVSYFAPLKWTLIGAVPHADLNAPAQELIRRQGIALALTLVLSLMLAWLLSAKLSKPLNQLARYALQLSGQDLAHPQPAPTVIRDLPSRYRDETGRLAAAFLHMTDRLVLNVRQLLEETTARERFENELKIAREIQLGLLPMPLPHAIQERLDLHALMVPAKQVGGDLYDYFVMPDGQLCVVIGDVSDKGIPAALFMAVTRTLIRTVAEDESDPALIVTRVNEKLAQNNPRLMFVTLIVATIDPVTRRLSWVNAGHPPPLMCVSEHQVWALAGRSGPACGIQAGIPYRSFSATMHPGDLLLSYTDGVTEAMAPDASQYGEQRLNARIAETQELSCAAILETILADVQAFAREAEQSDDITLIAVRLQ
ncbi:hypothetical protein ACMZ4X_03443 [Achromobacter marplatensis]